MADQSLTRSLDQLESKLDAQLASLNRSRNLNLILGIVLIVVIFGYFQFIGGIVKPFSDPKELSSILWAQFTSRIDTVRATAEKQAIEMTPMLVDRIADTLIHDKIPEGRKEVEKLVRREAEIKFNAAEKQVIESFDAAIKEHGPELRLLIAELKTDEGRIAFEDDLYKIMEEAVQDQGIMVQLDSLGYVLKDIDGMIAHYADPANEKTDDEKLLAELIAMMRELSDRTRVNVKDIKIDVGIKVGPGTTE